MAIADHKPSLLSRAVRRIILWIYRSKGWKAEGEVPADRRFVLVAAPHTTNWDFVMFLGLTEEMGIQSHFMGKTSLFRWPMRNFMLDMGGVPVDRSSRHDYVEQMISEFAARKKFILTVAPEGTRGGARKWKSGFYHIARGARVPLQLAFVDYSRKVGGLGPLIEITGDYNVDMERILDFYRSKISNFPEPEL